MDFLGNISLRLVGLIVTVGTLAAIYFFMIRPITDTTNNAFDSVAPAIEQATKQAAEAQEAAKQAAEGSGNGQQVQRCLEKAGADQQAIQRCATKFSY